MKLSLQLSVFKAWRTRVLQVIVTSVILIGVGTIAGFTLAIPAIAHPGPVFIAQATDPTPITPPIATPPSVPTTTPPPANPTVIRDRPAADRPPATEKSLTPTPESNSQTQAQTGGPYDMQAIEEFYKSLYGS